MHKEHAKNFRCVFTQPFIPPLSPRPKPAVRSGFVTFHCDILYANGMSNLDQDSAQNIVRGLLRAVFAWSWRNAALLETSSSKEMGSNPFTSTPALSIRERRMIRGQ